MPGFPEYLERLWKTFPEFLLNALNAVTNPKKLVRQIAAQFGAEPVRATQEAITFLAYSCVIAGLAGSLVAGIAIDELSNKFMRTTALVLIVVVVFVALEAAALRLAWWIVGGRVPYKKVFLADCYFFGITILLCGLSGLVFLGVQRVGFPNQAVIAINVLCILGLCIWAWYFWEAYRALNRLSVRQSLVALGLAIVLTSIVSVIDLLLLVGLVPQ